MPTIKDIANMAGVSHGTVSNVLNGRGNVSVKKIKLVEDAIEKLGYQLNLQAKILKQGSAKTISVILPNVTSEQYATLYDGLFSRLNKSGYDITLYLTEDSPELELQFIQKIAIKRDAAVIVVSCLDRADAYYQTIKLPKNKVIFVYRKPDLAEQFITLDFEQAGRDIAKAIINKGYHLIGVFTHGDENQDAKLLKYGLADEFSQNEYPVKFHQISSIPAESTYNLAFNFFNDDKHQIDVIVTSDIERANYIKNASYFGSLNRCPAIYTLSSYNCFWTDKVYQYQMNYSMLSQQIVDMIDGNGEQAVINQGFLLPDQTLPMTHRDATLNLLIIPSPSTDALRKLLPHFKKMTGINVNLVVKPFNHIYKIVNTLQMYPDIDIIRIDMAGLPWFAASSLKPLNQLDMDLDDLLSHYSKAITSRFSYVRNTVYAIPLDPSIQLLFYRRDLFEDPLIRRSYFEKYRSQLPVPTNFDEFAQVTEFFNQYEKSSLIESGSCVTLGHAEIIASEFLLRYYAKGGKLINQSRLALDMTIANATLNEFKQLIHLAKNVDSSWWQESVNQFEQGKLAMLIVYTNLFSYGTLKKMLPLIGYTNVPGNRPLLGGGALGMSKYSNKDQLVSTFFKWFYSKQIREQMALLSGATLCDSVFQNHKVMSHYPWLEDVSKHYPSGIRENHMETGQSINLRRVENIIGEQINRGLCRGEKTELTIERLNLMLHKEAESLIQ